MRAGQTGRRPLHRDHAKGMEELVEKDFVRQEPAGTEQLLSATGAMGSSEKIWREIDEKHPLSGRRPTAISECIAVGAGVRHDPNRFVVESNAVQEELADTRLVDLVENA